MKKLMFVTIFSIFGLSSCVFQDTAIQYAARAHPECSEFKGESHSHTDNGSQTEVSLMCDGQRKSITVKCSFGWGIISDTVCHENN